MKTCYLFLADGFEEIEALTVVDLLRRDRIPVSTVSVLGGDTVTGAHDITVRADCQMGDVDLKQASMLVLPGGQPGTNRLFASEELKKMILAFHESGGRLAAICAAPTVLGRLNLLNGRHAVCYPGCEEMLTGAIVGTEEVVTDGTITTSRGMGTAIPFALELVSLLDDPEKAAALAKGIVYRGA